VEEEEVVGREQLLYSSCSVTQCLPASRDSMETGVGGFTRSPPPHSAAMPMTNTRA